MEINLLQKAKNYALNILSRHAQTTKEITEKLRKRKYPDSVIEETISALKEFSYLDDKTYASSWIETRIRQKPRGKKLLYQELLQKGLAKETIQEALDNVFTNYPVNDYLLAQKALEKPWSRYKKLPKIKAYRRAKNFLLRRGFSYEIIDKILAKNFKE